MSKQDDLLHEKSQVYVGERILVEMYCVFNFFFIKNLDICLLYKEKFVVRRKGSHSSPRFHFTPLPMR